MKKTKAKKAERAPKLSALAQDLIQKMATGIEWACIAKNDGIGRVELQAKRDVSHRKLEQYIAELESNAGSSAVRKTVNKEQEKTRPVLKLDIVSTNLSRAAYNVETERLLVVFKNGSKYLYDDVTLEEFGEFAKADSQGKWFMRNIRDAKNCVKQS